MSAVKMTNRQIMDTAKTFRLDELDAVHWSEL